MPMPTRTRALKFTAVLAFVVLSLTGFSRGGHSGHGHSYGHSHGGGGGGCSSSHQDHDTSSSSSSSTSGGGSYDDTGDDSYVSGGTASTSTTGGTGGTYRHRPTHTTTPSASSGSGLQDGRVTLISCAGVKKPYATVQLTNPNGRRATFSVEVSFRDRDGTELDFNDKDVTVPANGTVRAEVAYDAGYSPDLPDHCEVEPRAGVEG